MTIAAAAAARASLIRQRGSDDEAPPLPRPVPPQRSISIISTGGGGGGDGRTYKALAENNNTRTVFRSEFRPQPGGVFASLLFILFFFFGGFFFLPFFCQFIKYGSYVPDFPSFRGMNPPTGVPRSKWGGGGDNIRSLSFGRARSESSQSFSKKSSARATAESFT